MFNMKNPIRKFLNPFVVYKLKEAMDIIWKKSLLNKQQQHVSISITL